MQLFHIFLFFNFLLLLSNEHIYVFSKTVSSPAHTRRSLPPVKPNIRHTGRLSDVAAHKGILSGCWFDQSTPFTTDNGHGRGGMTKIIPMVKSDGSAKALSVSLEEVLQYGRNVNEATGANGAYVAFTYLGSIKD